jgi:SpoVK/Ycf46/Vps4 family AAA+-type ATPase
MKKELIKGVSGLIKHDLVSLQDGHFRSDRDVMLTDKSLELLMEEDIDIILSSSKKNKNLILSKDIPHKKLFFNPDENNQLEELTRILEPANFSKIQKRLKSNNMSDGIAVLFHGCPGTGKTESTYQIARKIGRDIILVDMSDTKSMWYGESEKKIKSIFTDYKKLIGNNKLAPILVFNEADAVFSKRKNIGESAIDQTENTIQNIILQELEDFKGILIATTNLTNNFDKAFERRFLYKIEFHKPEEETRTKIWKDKIKGLTIAQARILASRFDLTGGNIDNVARKIMMDQILNNEINENRRLEEYCLVENIEYGKTKKIGFL